MEGFKSLLSSKTVIAGAVTAGVGLAQLFGYALSAEDQKQLVELISAAVITVTGLVGIYGRIVAVQKIGKPDGKTKG